MVQTTLFRRPPRPTPPDFKLVGGGRGRLNLSIISSTSPKDRRIKGGNIKNRGDISIIIEEIENIKGGNKSSRDGSGSRGSNNSDSNEEIIFKATAAGKEIITQIMK